MGHKMVYGIAGSACSNMAALKGAGMIDFHLVVRGGSAPTTNSWFVQTCNDNGVSPVFNNGNDGIPGANGYDYNSYYAQVAAIGWHAAGGESEPNAEWKAIMANMIGMDYGGEWNCCNDLSNIWVHQMSGERVSGHGMAAYLETYVGVCGVYLCHDAVVKAAVACRDAGCKEVGLMIGGWMVNHGVGAQPYINMINAIEAQGVTVSGIVLWWGTGTDMNSTYNVNAQVIRDLQAIWPPDMRTLKERFAGNIPPTPSAKHIPHIWCGMVDQPDLNKTNVQLGGTVGTNGIQGWLDTSTNDWAKPESLTAEEKAAIVKPVTLGSRDAAGSNAWVAEVTPNADGNFSAIIPSPSAAGVVHYNWAGATDDFGVEMAINWTAPPPPTSIDYFREGIEANSFWLRGDVKDANGNIIKNSHVDVYASIRNLETWELLENVWLVGGESDESTGYFNWKVACDKPGIYDAYIITLNGTVRQNIERFEIR